MTDNQTPARRMRKGERPDQALYFGPEAGQPRRFTILVTSTGHGLVQEYGSRFEHAKEGQEVLDVVEMGPGAQAAANKAAEEGGLPAFPEYLILDGFHANDPEGGSANGYSGEQMHQFRQEGIAADRASRQVANKAEVERQKLHGNGDDGWYFDCDGHYIDVVRDENGKFSIYFRNRSPESEAWLDQADAATPPATTGASTVLTDGRNRVREEFELAKNLGPRFCTDSAMMVVDELVKSVAAQAGQVAVPEGWRLVPVEPTEEMVGAGFESAPDEFFSPAEEWEAYAEMTGCQKAAHRARLCYAAMLAAAPASPAVAQQAPAQAKPLPADWISVEDTEPPEHELIAVRYWPYDNRENAQAVTGGRYIDGTFYNDEGNELHPPSHWCRLPQFDEEATAQASTSGERQEGGAA